MPDARFTISAERAFLDGTIGPCVVRVHAHGLERLSEDFDGLHFDESYLLVQGLINAHDHLEFNSFPILGRRAAYGDMYEWADDIKGQWDTAAIRDCLRIPFEDRLRIGGFKNLLNGVTTVAHHNPYAPCFDRAFPVEVVREYTWSHSMGLDGEVARTFRNAKPDVPWIIHAAEGVTSRARQEIDEMDRQGMLREHTILVHALGASPEQFETMSKSGVGLVWCPVSNQYLYGQTIAVDSLPAQLNVALASDSSASGSTGILEDLAEAQTLTGWNDERVWPLVTLNPRRMLRLPEPGSDLTVIGPDGPALVIRNGLAVYGDEEFRSLFQGETRSLNVRDRPMLLSKTIEIGWDSVARAREWTPWLREIQW